MPPVQRTAAAPLLRSLHEAFVLVILALNAGGCVIVTKLDFMHPKLSVTVNVKVPVCKPNAIGDVAPELQLYK